jgi:hypothetical protein
MRHALCHLVVNGAVAQLGERQNRTLEVGGSTPLCSTNDLNWLDELVRDVGIAPDGYAGVVTARLSAYRNPILSLNLLFLSKRTEEIS